ncbi:DNA polymerase III subunit chi [Phenylobacterium sp.]|uniref:DNA polymerase III subunit chi n=1 Tax=Phenylobacterium sp. TaxID=1871053 RepID=UPI002E319CFC|nr:DNA polymerase III subunit chi [Phenylobacterium sp.]HEX3366955.1 DNA polymerase III subunit chi [Phenylobacterium sp.]
MPKTPTPAAATEVWFYHLERTGLEQALPELLEKTLQRGWKAVVRVREADRVQHLDAALWTYRDESFLPHGADDEANAPRQPILLTTGFENANGADALFLVDGAEPGELTGYARCVVLFDGGDESQLAVARAQWSQVKAAGLPVSYWRQQARGWEKQA